MAAKLTGRRKFLKSSAAIAGLAAAGVRAGQSQASPQVAPQAQTGMEAMHSAPAGPTAPGVKMVRDTKESIAYGTRSHHVTSVRIPVAERMSPDDFGLTFHVSTPLQDSVGMITPSSLHYQATHRGSFIPDLDPAEHKLLIHGMVDRPLVFSMDDLKRMPSVSRPHFIECLGNRAKPTHKTVQETHGLTSCAEWTGVLLSTLLKECGVQKEVKWFVAEGAEEVKGASCLPLAKAMDDCLVAYGMNGEPIRPQQGFPLRLLVPGFEGIFQTKYLRRIKLVDRYYMTYNDYGHIQPDARVAALTHQWGAKSVITFPSGGQKLPGPGYFEISGLAWSGGGPIRSVEVSTDGGKTWKAAELKTPAFPMAHTRFGLGWKWDGKECVLMSRCSDTVGNVQPTREQISEFWARPIGKTDRVPGADNAVHPWVVASDGSVRNGLS